ncbi:MAG: glycosyltransferase [Clostridiales bacterium]|nr:glycosyltransferase [Clostridiales bacterium]
MNDIFIFSMLKWESALLHRSHMLAKYIYKNNEKVYYVEKTNTLNFFKWGHYKIIRGDVVQVRIYGLPYMKGRSKSIFKLNDFIIEKAMSKLMKNEAIKEAIALISTPHWSYAIGKVNEFRDNIYYDISDDYIAFADNGDWVEILKKYEAHAVEISQKSFITTETLIKKTKNNAVLIENGVDLDNFKDAVKIEFETEGQIIGFIGGLYDWVDYDLIVKIAQANPDDLIVIIGPTNSKATMEMIQKIDNVVYIGSIDKNEIHHYYASLDIGIIPFLSEKVYPRLRTVNSNKVYQYLYFNYPVVTTRFPQVEKLENYIYVSKSHDDFLENIKIAKEKGAKNALIDLKSISWETKAVEMLKYLRREIW